jgi:2-polyprenyl-6-hydroxyphenyl methylase/3-demethylubiquinone-9 3-methyltransferase
MSGGLHPICTREVPCKCCGARALIYGLVDFHKSCELYRGNPLEISGVPIYYHRCPECEFIFTTALDHFTNDDFSQYVYNDEYPLIDPDYRETRPTANASLVSKLFAAGRPPRVLDYGGGNGTLADLLRLAGFPHVETYDPFVPRYSARPAGLFDCVISFEVLEHSTDPSRTLGDMITYLTDTGLILFSTLLQPDDIDRRGLSWWYASPRNAHVSLYSKKSLEKVIEPFGFKLHSFDMSYHVFYREAPDAGRESSRVQNASQTVCQTVGAV